MSAHEAFNYADSVHDPYDTPTYGENAPAASDTFLAQRYVWWWWCPRIVKLAEPHYLRTPIPEFYVWWNEKLGPALDPLAAELERTDASQRSEVCTGLGFWDTGLNPTPLLRRVEVVAGESQLG